MRFSRSSAAVLALSLPFTLAQTSTDCNPTEKTCPRDVGLNNGAFTSDFTAGEKALASWSSADGTTMKFGDQGAEFSIAESGQAPTIQTDFYIFFGRVDVKMRAAPGTGIISSIVFESDDLDEIDWEFVGSDTTQVQSNFFGKGNTTSYDRVAYIPISTPQDEVHTYSVDWNSDRIEWIIDGKTVRTLARTDPLTIGGNNYPQTPMRIKIGSWCGGCKGNADGTIQWAGGNATFEGAPYVMYVESIDIQNYNPADAYEYSDKSGSWQSIKLIKDGSSSTPRSVASVSLTATDAVKSNQTNAPTKSLPVSHIMGTGVLTTKGGNFTVKPTGSKHGTLKTSTSLTTVSPTAAGATGSASASGNQPGMQNSAAALSIITSTSLLGVLFGFLLL